MKKSILLSTLFVFSAGINLFAQSLNWAYSIKNKDEVNEQVFDISSNQNNRMVVVGSGVKGKLLDIKNTAPGNNASEFGFIAVYNQNAELQWQKPAAAANGFTTSVLGVKMANNGDVFVYGVINPATKIDFDPGTAETSITGSANGDVYVQKFDADGDFKWVGILPNGGFPQKLIQLANGNLLIGGTAGIPSTVNLSPTGTAILQEGIFLAEFSSSGLLVKAMSGKAFQPSNCSVTDIVQDANGKIAIAGHFENWLDFDLGTGTSYDTTRTAIDAFVAVYNSSYDLQWQRSFGDTLGTGSKGWDYARSISSDAAGNFYVGGYFTWTCDFDPDNNPRKFMLTANSASQTPNGFILKYNSAGAVQWVKQIGKVLGSTGSYDCNLYFLKNIGSNLYALGVYQVQADLNPDPLDTFVLRAYGNTGSALFAAKYDVDGKFVSAISIDDTVQNQFAMTTESAAGFELLKGQLVMAGTFQKGVDFDAGSGVKILTCDPSGTLYSFDKDVFVASYDFGGGANGLSESVGKESILVYPNPAQNLLHINVKDKINNIQVFALDGKQVFQTSSETDAIDMSSFERGIYLISIETTNGIFTRKIILN